MAVRTSRTTFQATSHEAVAGHLHSPQLAASQTWLSSDVTSSWKPGYGTTPGAAAKERLPPDSDVSLKISSRNQSDLIKANSQKAQIRPRQGKTPTRQ